MINIKKQIIRLTIWSAFIGLVAFLTLWAEAPVLAQTITLQRVQIVSFQLSGVEVLDSQGNLVGTGEFRAAVSSNRQGRLHGRAELNLPDFTVEIKFTELDEILYEAGDPVGVVMRGRGTLYREGQSESFTAVATVRGGATTTIPDCLIWDIPEPAILDGLHFEAEGTLRFREG